MVRNRMRFYGKELLAPRPTAELEDHPLSAVRDCLFNIFAATVHIGCRSSIRNLRTRHAVVTRPTYHGTCWVYSFGKVGGEEVKDCPALGANWIFCWLNRRSVAYCQRCTWTAPLCEKLAAVRKDESIRRQQLQMKHSYGYSYWTLLRSCECCEVDLICTADQRWKQLHHFILCRTEVNENFGWAWRVLAVAKLGEAFQMGA